MDRNGQHTARTARHLKIRWGMALLVVAVAALAGCGPAATAYRGPTATPRATTTLDSVIRQGPLNWQPVTMPTDQFNMPISVAAGDGDIAYACAIVRPKGDGTTHTWVTRDRGQHWTASGAIAGIAGANECGLSVDDNDAQVVVATLNTASGGASPDPAAGASYASFDGGATWRALGKGVAIGHLASYHGAYYAVYQHQPTFTSPWKGGLFVSTDQMATWRPLGQDQTVEGGWFAVHPLSGSLLVSGDQTSATFARSDDGGAHWMRITLPAWTENILAAPQTGAQSWLLCVSAWVGPTGTTTLPSNMLSCSADGGQTWTPRPALRMTNDSAKGFTYSASAYTIALANDGAVLATVMDSSGLTHLYRLRSGSSTWESLGALPGVGSCVYSSGPGTGVLWQEGSEPPNPYQTATYQ